MTMELFKRRIRKRLETIENNIRYLKNKSQLTDYEKGALQILEEEKSCRTVEMRLFNEAMEEIEK